MAYNVLSTLSNVYASNNYVLTCCFIRNAIKCSLWTTVFATLYTAYYILQFETVTLTRFKVRISFDITIRQHSNRKSAVAMGK